MPFLIIAIVALLALIVYLLLLIKHINKQDDQERDQYYRKRHETDLAALRQQLENYESLTEKAKDDYEKNIESLAAQEQKARDRYAQQMINISKSVADATQTNSKFIKEQKEMIDDTLAEYYSDRVAAFDVDSHNQMTTIIDAMKEQYASEFAAEQSKLDSLSKEISSYQAKRDAINSEILRQRAIREQQDFYRIVLPEDSKQDITYILSIITQFKHPQTLYKLIWSEYIQRPFQSMFKNVAGGADPRNVIYKITNLTTGEIYIGKTKQELSKRWSDHIKTSLYITDSTPKAIHKALYNNWDNFSFEILEKVPLTDDLGAREKYYIDFYQSNIYGYNMVSGG